MRGQAVESFCIGAKNLRRTLCIDRAAVSQRPQGLDVGRRVRVTVIRADDQIVVTNSVDDIFDVVAHFQGYVYVVGLQWVAIKPFAETLKPLVEIYQCPRNPTRAAFYDAPPQTWKPLRHLELQETMEAIQKACFEHRKIMRVEKTPVVERSVSRMKGDG